MKYSSARGTYSINKLITTANTISAQTKAISYDCQLAAHFPLHNILVAHFNSQEEEYTQPS